MILYVTGHNHILAPRAASDYDYAEQDQSIAYQQTLVHPKNKPYTYAHRLSQILKARLHLDSTYYQTDAESVARFLNFLTLDHKEESLAILALTRPSLETSLQLNDFLLSYQKPDPVIIYYYELPGQFNQTWATRFMIVPSAETIFQPLLAELTMADAHLSWTKFLLKRLTQTE